MRTRRDVRASVYACVLASSVLGATSAQAVPARTLVDHANAAQAHGDYNTAARALDELVSAGIDSADVLVDLGLANARAQRYGEASWRLEQAARIAPFDSEIPGDLRTVRLALAHRDAARTGRAVVETALPPRTWLGELVPPAIALALVLAAQVALVAAGLAWRRRRTSEIARTGLAVAMVIALVVYALGGAVLVARLHTPPAAIVLHDGLRLLPGPSADAIPGAPVREGERVDVLDREAGFTRVRTLAGDSGWLARRDVGTIELH